MLQNCLPCWICVVLSVYRLPEPSLSIVPTCTLILNCTYSTLCSDLGATSGTCAFVVTGTRGGWARNSCCAAAVSTGLDNAKLHSVVQQSTAPSWHQLDHFTLFNSDSNLSATSVFLKEEWNTPGPFSGPVPDNGPTVTHHWGEGAESYPFGFSTCLCMPRGSYDKGHPFHTCLPLQSGTWFTTIPCWWW